MTPARGHFLAAILLSAVAAPGYSCQMAVDFLTSRGAGRHDFGVRLLALANQLNLVYYPDSSLQKGAVATIAAATEQWMGLYLQYYTAPPRRFDRRGLWTEHMDSVAGPLQRLTSFVKQGQHDQGHAQVEVLQGILTEFLGNPPLPDPHFLGGIRHALRSLSFIPTSGATTERERTARLEVLQDRYHRWKQGCTGSCGENPAVLSFTSHLAAFTASHKEGKPRSAELAAMTSGLKGLGQAWEERARSVKPTPLPASSSPEISPAPPAKPHLNKDNP